MLRSRVNCRVICELPKLDTEVICASDGICPNCRSSGVVTAEAIVSALAPGSASRRRSSGSRPAAAPRPAAAGSRASPRAQADHQQRRRDRAADEGSEMLIVRPCALASPARRRAGPACPSPRRAPARCLAARAACRELARPAGAAFCPSTTTLLADVEPLWRSPRCRPRSSRSRSARPRPCRPSDHVGERAPAVRAAPPARGRPRALRVVKEEPRLHELVRPEQALVGFGKIAFSRIVAVDGLIWLSMSASSPSSSWVRRRGCRPRPELAPPSGCGDAAAGRPAAT